MKCFHRMGDNKGSVTILAIGIMAFLGIILSGVLPMITQEVRIGTMNRDVLEAQYAAESGLKRAIAGLETGSTSWNWVVQGQARPFTNQAGKTYTVTHRNGSPQTLSEGNAPAAGYYWLQSDGRVGNALKRVSVIVQLANGGGVFNNGIFSASTLTMSNNATVVGSVGTNSSLTMSNNATVTGDATASGNIIKNNNADISGTLADSTGVTQEIPTFNVSFVWPSSTTINSAAVFPPGNNLWNTSASVSSGTYRVNSGLSIGKSTVGVQNNTTIYVKGGLDLNNGTTLTLGNNAVWYIDGNVNMSGSSKMLTQGAATIYIRGNLNINNKSNISLGGNTTIYVSGSLDITNNGSNITSAANTNVVIKVGGGGLDLNNEGYIKSGTNSSLAILVNGAASISNNAYIDSGLLLATGNINLSNNDSTKGSVISTGGSVSMSNNATVTYIEQAVSLVLTNNPGMITGGGGVGGGSNTVTTSEWKDL